jgi:tetratricopeptide (TPR) repeat protein
MKYQLFFLLLATSLHNYTQAQTNVIGATTKRISEAEAEDQSLFVDANQKYLLGQYDKAQELAEKIVYAQAKDDGTHFLLARVHLAQKNYNSALVSVKKAMELDPNNKWYYHLQAEIYEATGRSMDAANVYEELLKKSPTAPAYFDKISYLQTLSGEPEKALATLDRWQKANGMTEEIAERRHLICLGMKNDRGAVKALEDLSTAYPRNTEYMHKLAGYFRSTQRNDEAAGVYRRILVINPEDPEARIGAVGKQEVVNEKDFLATLRPLLSDPTISIDSKIGKLMPFLKKVESETDSTKRAMMQSAAKDLTVTHPNEAKAWSFAGDVHYLMNKNDEALELYEKCIKLQPEVFSVWQNTFEILEQKGNFKELSEIAEKGMDAFPNQPLSYYYFGLAANQLNKPNEALPQLQQAALMAGTNIGLKLDAQSQLGLAYLKNNKPEKVIELLEPTLAKNGTKHPYILEYLGDAYAAKGDRIKAMQLWKDAAKLNPGNAGLVKKIGG